MVCQQCGADFTSKNVRGRYCSAQCRTLGWRCHRYATLTGLEAQLTRLLTEVRALQGKPE